MKFNQILAQRTFWNIPHCSGLNSFWFEASMKIYVHLLLKLLNLLKLHTVSKSAPLSNPAQNNCVLRIIVQSIRQVEIALSGPIFSNLGRQNTNMAIKSLLLYFCNRFFHIYFCKVLLGGEGVNFSSRRVHQRKKKTIY